MHRRSLLPVLSLGAAPLCALPALAETVGSDRKNWLPDGLGYRARLGLLTPNDDAVPESAWWSYANRTRRLSPTRISAPSGGERARRTPPAATRVNLASSD